MQVIITTFQTARVIAKALWDGFFTHYSFSASILSDQAKMSRAVSSKNYVIWVVSAKFT